MLVRDEPGAVEPGRARDEQLRVESGMPDAMASPSNAFRLGPSATFPPRMSPIGSTPTPRSILAAAWPLFQVSWPGCLPLALLGVAASGAPQAAAVEAGEAHGFAHGGDWWGLVVATTVLVLMCQGAVVLRQSALAAGERLSPFDALRLAVRRLPQSAGTALLLFLPSILAIALVPVDRRLVAAVAAVSVALLLWLAFAWPAAILEPCGPLEALKRGARLVRGRLRLLLMLELTALAFVLVFVMLTGILLGVVMSIAGMGGADVGLGVVQLGLSRLLMAAVCAFPVVWLGAVWVTAYRLLMRSGQP